MTLLKFKQEQVRTLLEHARGSTEFFSVYGKAPHPSLVLVGDRGVYLMSAGLPPLMADAVLVLMGKSAAVMLLMPKILILTMIPIGSMPRVRRLVTTMVPKRYRLNISMRR